MDFGDQLPLGLTGCIIVSESQVRRCVDDHFQVESYYRAKVCEEILDIQRRPTPRGHSLESPPTGRLVLAQHQFMTCQASDSKKTYAYLNLVPDDEITPTWFCSSRPGLRVSHVACLLMSAQLCSRCLHTTVVRGQLRTNHQASFGVWRTNLSLFRDRMHDGNTGHHQLEASSAS
jgi:hypothetical protein